MLSLTAGQAKRQNPSSTAVSSRAVSSRAVSSRSKKTAVTFQLDVGDVLVMRGDPPHKVDDTVGRP